MNTEQDKHESSINLLEHACEEQYGSCYLCLPVEAKEQLQLALAALREKAEREKGCTHCQKPYVSIGGINEDKAIIYLGAERPYAKGNTEYLHHMDRAGRMNAFKIKFCPMCGRTLKEEHHEAD